MQEKELATFKFPPPPLGFWTKPTKTYGGKTMWIQVKSNEYFTLQRHLSSNRSVTTKYLVSSVRKLYSSRADAARIVMNEKPWHCIASASDFVDLNVFFDWLETLTRAKFMERMNPNERDGFFLYMFNILSSNEPSTYVSINNLIQKQLISLEGIPLRKLMMDSSEEEASEEEECEEETDGNMDFDPKEARGGKESNDGWDTSWDPFESKPPPPVSKSKPQATNENDDPDEANLCKICYENTVDIAILPCGHTMLCEACSKRNIATCPICRVPIQKFVKLFKC